MQAIFKDFLTISAQDDFIVQKGKNPEFHAHCSIRYVFLEIGNPTIGMLFLPEYGPVLHVPKHTIIFASIEHDEDAMFRLQCQNLQVLQIFQSFASLSNGLLEKFFECVNADEIIYSETMKNGSVLSLHNSLLQFKQNSKTMEKALNSRTQVVLSQINEPPAFGIHFGNKNAITWYPVDSFSDLAEWTLLLLCVIHNSTKNEDSIKNISIEIDSEQIPSTNSFSSIDNLSKISNDEQKENKTHSTFQDPRVLQTLNEEDEKKKDQQRIQEKKKEIQQLNHELSNQLSKYHQSITFVKKNPEPPFPQIIPTKNSTELPKPPQSTTLNPPEFSHLSQQLLETLSISNINVKRYLPNFQFPPQYIPSVSFNPNSPDSFETQITQAFYSNNQKDLLLLTASAILNGFNGHSSLSDIYLIEKGPTKNIEALKAAAKHFPSIFSYSFREKILKYYAPSSILNDKFLCSRLYNYFTKASDENINNNINNNIQRSNDLSLYIDQINVELFPFQFSHRPLKTFIAWMDEMLYGVQMKQLEAKWIVRGLVRCLSELFSSYMNSGITPIIVLKNSSPDSLVIKSWTNVQSGAEATAWGSFWFQCVSEGKVVQNFEIIISKKGVIEKSYKDCAPIRDPVVTSNIRQILYVFNAVWQENKLELPRGGEKSTLKSFQQFFGF